MNQTQDRKPSRQIIEHFAYIHSNKFITPYLFWKKFFHKRSWIGAAKELERQKKKGFLDSEARENRFSPTFYFLTPKALKILDDQNTSLIHTLAHSPHIRPGEKKHDQKVIELRIAFEADPFLSEIFWVSDYELRSGINREIKAKFLEGNFDKIRWRYNKAGKKPANKRKPDAYFEATIEGKRYSFILEYENKQYYQDKLRKMRLRLNREFPTARRLLVCLDEQNAFKTIELLKKIVPGPEQNKWHVSFFDKVVISSFKDSWFRVSNPLPFRSVPAKRKKNNK